VTGPGFTITPERRHALEDPTTLAALREGRLPRTRPAQVRQALVSPDRPVVTLTLVASCVLVFLAGLALAQRVGLVSDYLVGFGRRNLGFLDILHRIGGVRGTDLLAGEWWRLLTTGFVHIGALHLLMNMY